MFDSKTMQARFHALTAQRAEIAAKADPLRAKRDAAVAAHDAIVKPIENEIRAIEAPLFEIDRERALIARALGGKTGTAA